MSKFQFQAIGTSWEIDINEELSKDREFSLLQEINNRIGLFDKDYSRFRGDSLVTKMSLKSGEYKMPADFVEMISVYKKAYEVTNGLVTPLIGDVLVESGYDANYSLKKGNPKNPEHWENIIDWKEPILKIIKPTMLDFGACGKGYLVDIVSEIIESDGIRSYVVDAGGDMRQKGEEYLKVGLEDPNDFEKVVGVVNIKNQSICGSAGNRRKWADLTHIINPNTLKSPTSVLSVWVVSNNTIVSDILTTCLFFVPAQDLHKHFDFEYLILNEDYSIQKSEKFNADMFS